MEKLLKHVWWVLPVIGQLCVAVYVGVLESLLIFLCIIGAILIEALVLIICGFLIGTDSDASELRMCFAALFDSVLIVCSPIAVYEVLDYLQENFLPDFWFVFCAFVICCISAGLLFPIQQKVNPLIDRIIEKNMQKRAEQQRARVEAERKKQEELKQQEYLRFCEELVTKFWNDYLDSSEKTSLLLKRLKVALQNSGYQKWQEEFYDVVEKQTKERTRPPKEQRQKASNQVKDEELDDIRINFNGLFVTAAQYRILSSDINAQSLSLEDLIIYCRKLAEKMPEFRDFLKGKIIRTPQGLIDNSEAYALFGLTFETLTEDKLKQVYRYFAQLYHPDKNPNAKAKEMFQKVQSYHAYLKEELRRKVA